MQEVSGCLVSAAALHWPQSETTDGRSLKGLERPDGAHPGSSLPFRAILFQENLHATDMSHVTSVHLVHDLPHYAGDGAGGEKMLARGRTGSREGGEERGSLGFRRRLH